MQMGLTEYILLVVGVYGVFALMDIMRDIRLHPAIYLNIAFFLGVLSRCIK